MSLTAADVAEILRLLEESSFDELDLEINGVKLSLRRGGGAEEALNRRAARSAAGASGATSTTGATAATRATGAGGPASAAPSAASSRLAQNASPNSAATHAAPARATPADPNFHDVPSPLLGTFYRSPKPGAPPFVEVGSAVTEDTIVAIIEVMKLMNTVRAGARGTVAEILPTDGALVEYDQPILRIRKSG